MLPAGLLETRSAEDRLQLWTQILTDPSAPDSTHVYLAHVGRILAGFGACGTQRDESLRQAGYNGEISVIYVLQKYQRRGIGKALMQAMFDQMRAQKFHGVSLWVLHNNDPARRFYEKSGGCVVSAKADLRP